MAADAHIAAAADASKRARADNIPSSGFGIELLEHFRRARPK
jgi:hypothetical protein